MNEPLERILADAVQLLEGRQIPFAVIGGIAVSVHGEVRVTGDVDLILGVGVDRALTLIEALKGSPFEP